MEAETPSSQLSTTLSVDSADPKPKRRRYDPKKTLHAFGFIVEREWLVNFARHHEECPEDQRPHDLACLPWGLQMSAQEAGGNYCSVKDDNNKSQLFIAIAFNSDFERFRRSKDESRIKRLQDVVGREDRPDWHRVSMT